MAKQFHTFCWPCHGWAPGPGRLLGVSAKPRVHSHAGEKGQSDLCPPRDGLSGSKKNEGLSGAAVFY